MTRPDVEAIEARHKAAWEALHVDWQTPQQKKAWRDRAHSSFDNEAALLAYVAELEAECERLRAELAAEEDLRTGRFQTFDTMDDMIADLKGPLLPTDCEGRKKWTAG
jgi:hypothetical protein